MRCSRIEEADSDAGQPAGTVFRIGQGGKARTRKVECPGFSRHPGASQNTRPQITIKPMPDIKLFALEKGSAKEVHGRDRLPEICSVPKVLKKFANRAHDFEKAYEGAVDAGADSTPYKKLATQEAFHLSAMADETRSGDSPRADPRRAAQKDRVVNSTSLRYGSRRSAAN